MHGPTGQKLLTEGAHCALHLTDGHFLSIRETCKEVEEAFERAKE
jgi:hypothetical protein